MITTFIVIMATELMPFSVDTGSITKSVILGVLKPPSISTRFSGGGDTISIGGWSHIRSSKN
jgi:hypothetical protein